METLKVVSLHSLAFLQEAWKLLGVQKRAFVSVVGTWEVFISKRSVSPLSPASKLNVSLCKV